METLIIGAGSLGSLLAARLSAAGVPVTLFGRPSPHLSRIAGKWLTVEEPAGSRLTVRLRTGSYEHPVRLPALAIVAVKTWATEDALRRIIPSLDQVEAVLTLQNGIGNAQRIKAILPPRTRVLTGVTTQGALRTEAGVVRDTGPGDTWIGSEFLDEDPGALDISRRVAATLDGAGWKASAVNDILPHLWMKLATNAAINPLTALTRVLNGEIANDPNLAQLAGYLATEAAAVASALGVQIDDPVEQALEVARMTGENRSSMLRDIEQRRRTETEAITGAIHELGEAYGVNTPITTMMTIMMYALERGISASAVEADPVPTPAEE